MTVRIPILRQGRPYWSLDKVVLGDLRNGRPVAEVSQANAGLVVRDLLRGREAREALDRFSTRELLDLTARAAELFARGDLPLGDGHQGPEEYLAQLSATTGMPVSLARRNLAKIENVLVRMPSILAGLTRGLDPELLDRGFGLEGGRMVSFRRETEWLGAILPSNSPGVHGLWLPALPLKVGLALKPGRQEPWTPHRVCQAFAVAGLPGEALGFYPGSHAAAGEILLRAGRSMLFGDAATVAPWKGDPRVEIHGPGWSKVVLGEDQAERWPAHLEVIAASVAENGGRSCLNASGVWTAAHGRELAQALAERLAQVRARGLDDPEAALAAFPSKVAAERVSAWVDRQLEAPGAQDLSAPLRGPRVVEVDGCAFLLPTVVWLTDPEHPLAQAELLFPFVTVVEVPQAELLARMGPSLVVTALTDDPAFRREFAAAPQIDRLNLGPIPTSRIDWDQPHEGNLFDLLYRRRSFQALAEGA
ncbi:MAG TPA: aldehyde dehydrogenase family protein [Thermoanaerobaculia bacterium]|nr:aldehyde dehydrogenase family protein [Thermoanaerobaculia bacterium]